MPTVMSTATAEEIDEFRNGSCHVFAAALHRMTGWPFVVVLDHGMPYWIDQEDDDNYLPSVPHVFCRDPEGHCWDVLGHRPYSDIEEEMTDWIYIESYGTEELADEEELRTYVGCWSEDVFGNEIERPLAPYQETDVEAARVLVGRVLEKLLRTGGVKIQQFWSMALQDGRKP